MLLMASPHLDCPLYTEPGMTTTTVYFNVALRLITKMSMVSYNYIYHAFLSEKHVF